MWIQVDIGDTGDIEDTGGSRGIKRDTKRYRMIQTLEGYRMIHEETMEYRKKRKACYDTGMQDARRCI